MRCAHPYQDLHLRHRPPIPFYSHQFHLLPSLCMIRVLVETGGGITSISGHISLNWSSTGSLLSLSSTTSKIPDFCHSLTMTASPSGLLMQGLQDTMVVVDFDIF